MRNIALLSCNSKYLCLYPDQNLVEPSFAENSFQASFENFLNHLGPARPKGPEQQTRQRSSRPIPVQNNLERLHVPKEPLTLDYTRKIT